MLGYQPVRPSGFQTWPRISCTMKRPTRVPASRTVRMKSASNMIAKWYQSAEQALAADRAAEDLGHADGEGRRAAGAVQERLLADLLARGASIVAGVERRSPRT